MSDWQFEEARNMAVDPETNNVFLVFRVGGVGGEEIEIEVIEDLWKRYVDGTIGLRAPNGLVVVRK